MGGFEDFLLDYEEKETEEVLRFYENARKGKIERFPPLQRFVKAREPLATTQSTFPIWGVIPFFGSTIFGLIPMRSKRAFDQYYSDHGFTSRDIDKLIDFVKEYGRLQFVIDADPSKFRNMEFLEPLFEELRPPRSTGTLLVVAEKQELWRSYVEFDTLAELGLNTIIEGTHGAKWGTAKPMMTQLKRYYAIIKMLGYKELLMDITDSMVLDPVRAFDLLYGLGQLLSAPFNPLRTIQSYTADDLADRSRDSTKYNLKITNPSLFDIGKFILRKMVHYPLTMDGCKEIIQYYDDRELRKVLEALYNGAKDRRIESIQTNANELSRILDGIWKDADSVARRARRVSLSATASFGVVGTLLSGLPVIGIMAALGFPVLDEIMGAKPSEKIAKLISSDYLVTVYDFKKVLRSEK